MAGPRSSFLLGSAILALTFFPKPAQADEIRLKDGQKLYGVIVAYEDNMFKVKTDFGYVLVEKDKIASIVPNVTAAHNAAKTEPPATDKPASARAAAVSAPEAVPEKKTISFTGPTTPIVPTTKAINSAASIANPPALKPTAKPPVATLVTTDQPTKPKEIEPQVNRETLQGNTYINYTHGFQMYKPPSWKLLDEAGHEIVTAIDTRGPT